MTSGGSTRFARLEDSDLLVRLDVDQHIGDARITITNSTLNVMGDCVTLADGDRTVDHDVKVYVFRRPHFPDEPLLESNDSWNGASRLPHSRLDERRRR